MTDSWHPEVLLVAGGPVASFDSGLTNGADTRVWLITGASSGFGRAITEAALARGDSVAAGARSTDAFGDLPEGVHPLALDVTNSDQREAAVAETVERFGRIDVLVNNAGRRWPISRFRRPRPQ